MTPRFSIPSRVTTHHPSERRTRTHRLRSRFSRVLRLAAFIALAWLAAGPAPLLAQRNEREARSLVSSVAATVYNLAWPTAAYEGFTFGQLQRVSQGYDVPILLYGRSGWSGDRLWLEIVLELRNGSISDVRLGRDNAVLARPFSTVVAIGALGVAIAQALSDEQNEAMLVGTWRDENSVFTYSADGWFRCDWDSGSSATGTWTVQDGTLTWRYSDGSVTQYRLEYVGQNEHRTRSVGSGTVWTARRIR